LELIAFDCRVKVDIQLKIMVVIAILLIRIVTAIVGPVAHPTLRDALVIVAKKLVRETECTVMLVVIFRAILNAVASTRREEEIKTLLSLRY